MRCSASLLSVCTLLASIAAAAAGPPPARSGAPAPGLPVHDAATGETRLSLWDGSTVRLGTDGIGVRTDASGRHARPVASLRASRGLRGGAADTSRDLGLLRRFAVPDRGPYVKDEVLVALRGADLVAGARAAQTTDAATNAALAAVGARAMRPLFAAVKTRATAGAIDLAHVFVVDVAGMDARAAARRLASAPGVAYAAPNWTVNSFATDPVAISAPLLQHAPRFPAAASRSPQLPAVPDNYGVTTSEQAYLNANGVDAIAAYAAFVKRFGELPGQGTTITNVSLGDLTDQQMADDGDFYVMQFGPTTAVVDGQRYLDYPSLPLIPTWVARGDGSLDPLGTVEYVDPYLGEVLLDFSVMAPLPHALQRPEAPGDGYTDLFGIAPGAQYRLVVPEEPTIAGILRALDAAAHQDPRPDVINASLGYGLDTAGFPGRFLEDDPLARAIVQSIVDAGIVVTIATDDGTRPYTNAAIGPDGGSAPTLRAAAGDLPTTVFDVGYSTAPSITPDTGSIAAGGSTLDDVLSVPPHAGTALAHVGSFPATRLNGGQGFSSAFGSRLDLSAPSDNIAQLLHVCTGYPCTNRDVIPVLGGGTSAAAPMAAAAAAVLIHAARLTGQALTPRDVRSLLAATGRVLPQAPQTTRPIDVGPQLDVAAALDALLLRAGAPAGTPSIVRLAVAHRQWAALDLGASFIEVTDPANIDLAGPYDWSGPLGQNAVSPITFAADVTGVAPGAKVSYVWRVGNTIAQANTRVLRLLPAEIAALAHVPLASDAPRTIPVTLELRSGSSVLASISRPITFGPNDATHAYPLAPLAPAVVPAGASVPVHYDLSGTRGVSGPALIVSSIGHFNALTAPLFREELRIPLTATSGVVDVPASAFAAGAGIYGLTLAVDAENPFYGPFTTLRVESAAYATRPPAPTLGLTPGDAVLHTLSITRDAPQFAVRWDVSGTPGADGARLEISAPGPTIYGLYNTFTNQNGDRRDANGVDSGSVFWRRVAGTTGTLALDASELGLPSSLFYTVRVFPVRGDAIAGQASPVSSLEFDDGVVPAGLVTSFGIDPDGTSFVSTTRVDGPYTTGSSVLRYDAWHGTYGAPLVEDASGNSEYRVFGVDGSSVLTLNFRYDDGTQHVEARDATTGARTSGADFDPWNGGWYVQAGRLDDVRHRVALLTVSPDDYSDNAQSFDVASGALSAPVFADNGPDWYGFFTGIDVDRSSGHAFLSTTLFAGICLMRDAGIADVDLDAGSAQPVVQVEHCMTGAAADGKGQQVYATIGPLISFPSLLPVGQLQTVDQHTSAVSDPSLLGARSPIFPVVDPVHDLLVVGFLGGDRYTEDNNAMSAVGVFDTQSGARLAYMPFFNLVATAFGNNETLTAEHGIQLDPKTRTGWTYGPGGVQVQRFRY